MDQEPGTIDPASVERAVSANASSAPPAADEIRSRIEQTRAEMTETIDAIQDRLSPSRIVSSATERVKDATTANPVPIALMGAAAAALTAAAWTRSRDRRRLLLGACTGIACWGALTRLCPRILQAPR
jgi:hypothetical protein